MFRLQSITTYFATHRNLLKSQRTTPGCAGVGTEPAAVARDGA